MKRNRCPVNVAAVLLNPNLEAHPDKPAYICDAETVSYRDLAAGAYRFASLLLDQGIRKGDRILIVVLDSPVFVAAVLGATLIGAVPVPVSTALSGELYDYICTDCAARLILVSQSLASTAGLALARTPGIRCGEHLREAFPNIPATPVPTEQVHYDDLAYMLYTSGSTGIPKGVPHRHADLVAAAENYAVRVLGMRESDTVLSASKLYFAYGLGNSLAFPMYVGATAVLHSGSPLPARLLSLMEQRRPTLFFAVPTIYAQIIRTVSQEHLTLPMRLCISAGELLPTAVFQEWHRLTGLAVLDGLGSTETGHIVLSNRPGETLAGSAGLPVPGYEIRLVDDGGAVVPSGVTGNLLVRGPSIAPFYWNQPEKTAATMLSDGFIRTGDLMVERDGHYFHQGRNDDMLKVGGQWVSPVQVEEVLRGHPAVADCAVAVCHVGALEYPAAHLILRQGYSSSPPMEKELRAFAAVRLPDYMHPLLYQFVDDLPRTPTGKVQRFKLSR
ncbi:benzoate-CoA ligase family protein [uncultured Thiodictyon sp.]|uniref:benzoate-CoA ligase family protein n=1 Tax=uncultured Thiodictyon sp. TaxID=1846217 RepID=UPI0025F8BE09|nr:benzoate-CoA ligase family protein [uncultured Thiodictyon sp.]